MFTIKNNSRLKTILFFTRFGHMLPNNILIILKLYMKKHLHHFMQALLSDFGVAYTTNILLMLSQQYYNRACGGLGEIRKKYTVKCIIIFEI